MRSSAGEHLVHTEGVTGSIPVASTTFSVTYQPAFRPVHPPATAPLPCGQVSRGGGDRSSAGFPTLLIRASRTRTPKSSNTCGRSRAAPTVEPDRPRKDPRPARIRRLHLTPADLPPVGPSVTRRTSTVPRGSRTHSPSPSMMCVTGPENVAPTRIQVGAGPRLGMAWQGSARAGGASSARAAAANTSLNEDSALIATERLATDLRTTRH